MWLHSSETAQNARNSAILALKPDWRKCPVHSTVELSGLFLWKADTQSGFSDSARRT
jgi:hypothetical protein